MAARIKLKDLSPEMQAKYRSETNKRRLKPAWAMPLFDKRTSGPDSGFVAYDPIDIFAWPYQVDTADVVLSVVYHGLPLGKSRPRVTAHGTFTPKSTKVYEGNLKALFVDTLKRVNPDGDSRFALRCLFHRPTRQRIDCDNLMKAISDAANGIVWVDDSQVLEIIGRLFLASTEAKAVILIHKVRYASGKKICPTCGAEFTTSPSIIQIHCSAKCSHDAKRLALECRHCKKSFSAAKSTVKRSLEKNGHVFCSRSCAVKHMRATRTITSSTKGKFKNRCEGCGKKSSRREYRFCRACSMERKNPSSNYWRRNPIVELEGDMPS